MFRENTQFRVTIRDFLDRVEPQVLKNAGSVFVRAIREASADYLENSLNPDEELIWTVTMHEKLNVGTIHYAVHREDKGMEGKCLVWDLGIEPRADRPWVPIVMGPGELVAGFWVTEELRNDPRTGVYQPQLQDFRHFAFKGWIPVNRLTSDLVNEDSFNVLVGAGFSPSRLVSTVKVDPDTLNAGFDLSKNPSVGIIQALSLIDERLSDDPIVLKSKIESPDIRWEVTKKYQFDVRPLQQSIAMRVEYHLVQVTDNVISSPRLLATYVAAEGGWLPGNFIKWDGEELQVFEKFFNLKRTGKAISLDDLKEASLAEKTAVHGLKEYQKILSEILDNFISSMVAGTNSAEISQLASELKSTLHKHYLEEYITKNVMHFPLGMDNPADISDWLLRAAVEVKHEGHPDVPN